MGKKVTFLRFHPTASNVLASASADTTVKLWDIEKGGMIADNAGNHADLIQDIVWDYTGDCYATSCKDKNVRINDARTASVVDTIVQAHEGAKCVKLHYLGAMDKLLTVGFSKQSQRQFKIWDPRNTSKEIKKVDIDQASGAIMPFFDPDTQILYLCGKGDGNIRYYEISDTAPFVHPIEDFKSSVSCKGCAMVPKRSLNIMSHETARLLKLTTNSVEPLSFYVPRKGDSFQDDIFPDTYAGIPAHTADEWMDGSSLPPALKTLNPSGVSSSAPASPPKVLARPKSSAVLTTELETANARIKLLEERLAAAGLSTE